MALFTFEWYCLKFNSWQTGCIDGHYMHKTYHIISKYETHSNLQLYERVNSSEKQISIICCVNDWQLMFCVLCDSILNILPNKSRSKLYWNELLLRFCNEKKENDREKHTHSFDIYVVHNHKNYSCLFESNLPSIWLNIAEHSLFLL